MKLYVLPEAQGSEAKRRGSRGPVAQLLVMIGSAVWICAGGPLHVLALLLAATSLSLVLLVLDAEKRRNAALHATLDRLSREVGVRASGQD